MVINGDIRDRKHALELHAKYPGVDGFMIGRGVFQNPYCFTDHVPTRGELMGLLEIHLDLYEPSYEPLKHYFKIYVNNFSGAKELRAKLMETHSVEEARKVLENCN